MRSQHSKLSIFCDTHGEELCILVVGSAWFKQMFKQNQHNFGWNRPATVCLNKTRVCFDSYLWPLSFHKVTFEHAFNWAVKKRGGCKKVAMPLFQFLNGVKVAAGGVGVVWGCDAHMCELMRIDVTVSAMNHAGCGWAEFECGINCLKQSDAAASL